MPVRTGSEAGSCNVSAESTGHGLLPYSPLRNHPIIPRKVVYWCCRTSIPSCGLRGYSLKMERGLSASSINGRGRRGAFPSFPLPTWLLVHAGSVTFRHHVFQGHIELLGSMRMMIELMDHKSWPIWIRWAHSLRLLHLFKLHILPMSNDNRTSSLLCAIESSFSLELMSPFVNCL